MCGSQVLFGMLGRMEHVDLGALVAPRPLLVENGRDDLLFPRGRRRRPPWPGCGRSTNAPGPATVWSTTPSTVSTSGTAPWPTPSSTAGWVPSGSEA